MKQNLQIKFTISTFCFIKERYILFVYQHGASGRRQTKRAQTESNRKLNNSIGIIRNETQTPIGEFKWDAFRIEFAVPNRQVLEVELIIIRY